jgi:uncharacterized membrane protein (DUF2068 family)
MHYYHYAATWDIVKFHTIISSNINATLIYLPFEIYRILINSTFADLNYV